MSTVRNKDEQTAKLREALARLVRFNELQLLNDSKRDTPQMRATLREAKQVLAEVQS